MKKKYYWIVGIIAIISINGCIFNRITYSDFYSLQEKQVNELDYSIIREYNKTFYSHSLAVEDLDNDGNNEIIYTSADNIYDNLIHILDKEWNIRASCFLGNSGNGKEKMLFEDLDKDGKKEIISAGANSRHENYTLKIFDSNCTKLKEFIISRSIEEAEGLFIEDIDNDNTKEIVIETFHKISIIDDDKIKDIENNSVSIFVGDINNDGKNEIVAGDYKIVFALDIENKLLWKYSINDWVDEIYIGDLDNDGKNEIVVSDDNDIFILNSEGKLIKKLYTNSPKKIFMSDLDNDGKKELIVGSYIFDSKFNLKWKYDLPGGTEIIEDLDNDGKKELIMIVAEPQMGTTVPNAVIFIFDADGKLLWNYKYSTWISPVATADLDNDGNKELLIAGYYTAPITVFGKK
jgi:hypothetical protein